MGISVRGGRDSGATIVARRVLPVLIYAAVAVFATWSAYSHVFSHFADYDDQGYLLMIVRSFAQGAPLYEETFSQYGPFFAIFHRAVFALLGLPPALDSSGLIQVGYWAGTTTLAGIAAHVSTRRLSLGLLAAGCSFVVLETLRHEPLHPIALIAFLLAAVWLALALVPRWPRTASAAGGVLVAAVALVKLNVGVFLIVGLGLGLSLTSQRLRRRAWLPAMFSVAAVVMPFILMGGDITRETNLRFASLVGLSALGLVAINVAFAARGPDRDGAWRWWVGGAAGMAALVVGTTVATGTRPTALVEGMLLRPMRQVEAFTIAWQPHLLPLVVVWFAAGVTAVAVVVGVLGVRAGWRPSAWWLSLMKLAAALLTVTSLLVGEPWPFLAMAPLAWVAAIDVPDGHVPPLVRAAMPMVAVLHTLHAYPVAGAQRGVAVYLLVVVAAICFDDAWSAVHSLRDGNAWRGVQVAVVVACIGTIAFIGRGAFERWWLGNWDVYRRGSPLNLRGAELYHIEEERVEDYRTLTDALTDRCSTFYSLPGLGSLYVFTGMRPPTSYVVTDWMDLLTDREQASVVAALEGSPRPCIVRYENGLRGWLEGEELPDTPLIEYIRSEYRVVEEIGPYELLVHTEDG